MSEYKVLAHARYRIQLRIVLVVKYKKKILVNDAAKRVRQIIREICKANDVDIQKGEIFPDYVSLLVTLLPYLPVSTLVKKIKEKSTCRLLKSFSEIRSQFYDDHLWAHEYFVASVGECGESDIKAFVAGQEEESRDDFRIVDSQG